MSRNVDMESLPFREKMNPAARSKTTTRTESHWQVADRARAKKVVRNRGRDRMSSHLQDDSFYGGE